MNANKKYIGEIFIALVILIIFIILCKKNLEQFYLIRNYNDKNLSISDYVGYICPFENDKNPIFLMYRKKGKNIYDKSEDYMVEYIKINNEDYFVLKELNSLKITDIDPKKHRFLLQKLPNSTSSNNTFKLFSPDEKYYYKINLNQVCENSSKKVGNCQKTTALYIIKDSVDRVLHRIDQGQNKFAIFSNLNDITEDKKTFYFKCYYCEPRIDTTHPDFSYLEGGHCKDISEPKYI